MSHPACKEKLINMYIYHVIEIVLTVGGTHCGWCANMIYIASFQLWFESYTDEHTIESNVGTCFISLN